MNKLTPLPSPALALPALIASADDRAQLRFIEFFAANIRNLNTRRAYALRADRAALTMRAQDAYIQNRRLWVRLHEKGGKRHKMACHHSLEEYLHAYIDGCGLGDDPKGPLFRTILRGTGRLSTTPCPGPAPSRWCAGGRLSLVSGRRSATTPHPRRARALYPMLLDRSVFGNRRNGPS